LSKNLTQETAKSFGTFLEKIADKGAGTYSFAIALNRLISTNNLSDTQQNQLLSQISAIDFTDKEKALNQLQNVLEGLGIDFNENS
jgi:hypothetical protein